MLNKKSQTRTKSPSPFSVTIGEVASIATPQEIQEYREEYDIYGDSLSEIGNHFAIRDDAKRVILAKLLGIKPNPNLRLGEAIDDLVETKVTLWEEEGHDIDLPVDVGNLSANQIRDLYVGDLRQALKYALRDMLDEAAYLVENYTRERVMPSGGSTPEEDLETLNFAQHQLNKYGLKNLSILDFDLENNEKLISLKRKQRASKRELSVDEDSYYIPFDEYMEEIELLQENADDLLDKADSSEEGSYEYKRLLQIAVNNLNKAISICGLAIAYYADLRDKNIGNSFVEDISELMEKKKELKEERETLFEFITLYDEKGKLAAQNSNWYKIAKNRKL